MLLFFGSHRPSPHVPVTPFSDLVMLVLHSGSRKQVIRIAARRIVAAMADVVTFRDRSVEVLEDDSMHLRLFAVP
jgi:hypothetical protein